MQPLIVKKSPRMMTLTISRPERGNSINAALIHEINAALDDAEQTPDCRTVVLEGQPGVFCTGMDFHEASAQPGVAANEAVRIDQYLALLKRFTLSPKIIVSRIDGKVIAGGVGLVAASDLAVSTPRAEFSLSEALWGLLPCCVLPFLIRRIGFQKAYTMTLTTKPISAQEAQTIHLLDELTDNLDETIRKLTLRLNLLDEETIVDLKQYFRRMWLITPEMEKLAIDEIGRLAAKPKVRQNIANYATRGIFPWEQQGKTNA
ncbi:MAG: enoyl-CoA hydratase/isomerase [Verrucomicrobiae bacterium]|nr:enoyl-CoA hydratase/isomerase [Verrucomicrobiae bacterium]